MFVDYLFRFEQHAALVLQNGEWLSYSQLQEKVDYYAELLSDQNVKQLIFLYADNSAEAIIAYLACLRSRQSVLLLDRMLEPGWLQSLHQVYQPSWQVTVDGGGLTCRKLPSESSTIHPDLAVMLSTSGSTGTPKQVKLSFQNIQANAEAIATYLPIDQNERAILSLPMHYSYGLSIINSHLSVGGTLVLCDHSIVSREFWQCINQSQVTSFAGVPFTYETLHKLKFERMTLPSLKYMTQAGGRLAPERVQYFARALAQTGKSFYVMYGQTEATARISYVPPELIASHPDSIGVAIPGGELTLENESGHVLVESEQVGELVYRGSNVMMGYACNAQDLATPPELEKLKTGDMARRADNGLYFITGRKSRCIKLYGHRIDLDEVEKRIAEKGITSVCVGNDTVLGVAVDTPLKDDSLKRFLVDSLKLHHSSVNVCRVDSIPRTPNNKVNYALLAQRMGLN